ncbi:helix-turn-helix transcriptional regulator [Amycolatopsis sp. cg5]|uniref:helix-turn-helix transcriptional regulator n=1 Tax=Amycolatopsis sp. cg5 TaxID=3238802 RepID=UPI00352481B1
MVATRNSFRQARKAAGYTQESFAAALNVDRTTVQRWEAGSNEPQPYLRPKLARLLHISAEQLEHILRSAGRLDLHNVPNQPLTAPTAPASRPAAELTIHIGDDTPSKRGAPTDLTAIQAMATAFQIADRKVGGGQLYPTVLHYLHTEISPRLFDPTNDALGTRLFEAAASLTEIAGWMAHDGGRDQHARHHFGQAYRFAAAVNHAALAANICASMSHLAGQLAQPHDAIRIAKTGLAHAELGPARQRLSARLHAMGARGFALQGDVHGCLDALASAEQVLNRAHEDSAAEWISHFDEGSLASEAACCFGALGNTAEAERQAHRVLELRVGDRVRSRAFGQLTLAEVLVRTGEIEEAAALGKEVCAAAGSLTSHRVHTQLADLSRSLQKYRDVSSVTSFLADCEHVLEPPPAEDETPWPV